MKKAVLLLFLLMPFAVQAELSRFGGNHDCPGCTSATSLFTFAKPRVMQFLGCTGGNSDCQTLAGWDIVHAHVKTHEPEIGYVTFDVIFDVIYVPSNGSYQLQQKSISVDCNNPSPPNNPK